MRSDRSVRRTWTKAGAATLLMGAMLALTGTVGTPAGANHNEGARYTICHRTNSNTNPYVVITVDEAAVDGEPGRGNDHFGQHQGPVWNPGLKDAGTKWGDIIPPVPGHHNGLNWTTEGQAIFDNDCQPTTPPGGDNPSISITKTPVDSTVVPGDGIAYDITVTAGGTGSAEGVTISDSLDGDYDWSENSGSCSISAADVLTCNVGTLASGASFTVQVSATTPDDVCATVDNTATVDATNIAGSPDDTDSSGNVITIDDPAVCPPPAPVTSPGLTASLACVADGFRVSIANTGDAAGVVDVTSDGAVVHDDVAVPVGGSADVVVSAGEGEPYDIDVREGADVVRSFEGTRDCVTVGGVVIPAPSPAPGPGPAPAALEVTPAPQVAGNVVARQLPRTGGEALPMAEVGFGLVLLGAGIMLASREELRTA